MSYNFGANKPERVKEAFWCQFTICVVYTALFWLAMMLVPQIFAALFTTDQDLAEYTAWAMRIYMAGILASGFQTSCQQSFIALGQAKISLLLACLRKLILLIPLILLLPHLLPEPVFAVFLAEPISDILAATVTTYAFLRRFRKLLAAGAAENV
jgi:Na+-driven multidrug efflux pump